VAGPLRLALPSMSATAGNRAWAPLRMASVLIVTAAAAVGADEPTVPSAEMRRVYEAARTPYTYGIVLRPEEGSVVDCPSVFRHAGTWYML
jgi:hypothetical protein